MSMAQEGSELNDAGAWVWFVKINTSYFMQMCCVKKETNLNPGLCEKFLPQVILRV